VIENAIMAIQLTGLFETVLTAWNALPVKDQEWPEVKVHFTNAY